jgi:hypothetical protein
MGEEDAGVVRKSCMAEHVATGQLGTIDTPEVLIVVMLDNHRS